MIDRDSLPSEQDQQTPVAEAPALGREPAQLAAEFAIVGTTGPVAVGLRRQADQPAGPPLRVILLLDRPGHGLSP